MTRPINTDSIANATSMSWEEWVRELDARGARKMSHTELARKLYDELDGTLENHGWWAQGITVAYEQHIGKRVPGQLVNGLFELAVSKTIVAERTVCFARVAQWFESQAMLNDHEIIKPRISETPKRSNWRCDFADGSKFAATVEENGQKSKLVLSHTAIPSQLDADEWKAYWKHIADELPSAS